MTLIKNERPPNFDSILAAFPHADQPGIVFAYGEHIYAPGITHLPHAIVMHECVHLKRQQEIVSPWCPASTAPDMWWDRYLTEPEFRYNEELLAHAAEYRSRAGSLDRNSRARLLHSTALRLIAPLYNYAPPRNLAQAVRDLTAVL